ncbi:MAG: hypothetical protein ACI3W8_05615 [Oscillospiraceae bacterium]
MRLRFWLREAGGCLLGGGAVAVFIPLFFGLTNGGEFLNFLAIVPAYFLLGTGLVTAIAMTQGFKSSLPLALAMGSTRQESFWGLQVMKFLPNLIALLVAWCVYCFFVPDLLGMLWAIAAVVFAAVALGDMTAMASYRWGKAGAVLATIVLAGFGGAIGGSVSLALNGGAEWLSGLFEKLDPPMAILFLTAGVLAAADLALERRALQKFEVRM